MTNLEIALSCLSIVETIVTILLHRKMKKKLDAEQVFINAGVECLFMFEGA